MYAYRCSNINHRHHQKMLTMMICPHRPFQIGQLELYL